MHSCQNRESAAGPPCGLGNSRSRPPCRLTLKTKRQPSSESTKPGTGQPHHSPGRQIGSGCTTQGGCDEQRYQVRFRKLHPEVVSGCAQVCRAGAGRLLIGFKIGGIRLSEGFPTLELPVLGIQLQAGRVILLGDQQNANARASDTGACRQEECQSAQLGFGLHNLNTPNI